MVGAILRISMTFSPAQPWTVANSRTVRIIPAATGPATAPAPGTSGILTAPVAGRIPPRGTAPTDQGVAARAIWSEQAATATSTVLPSTSPISAFVNRDYRDHRKGMLRPLIVPSPSRAADLADQSAKDTNHEPPQQGSRLLKTAPVQGE